MSDCLKRREFIRLAGAAAGFAAVAPGSFYASPKSGRLNVLLITVDDLRPELGCYGVGLIRTPNIDRLAAEGTAFTRAYCAQGVCNPSRVSILTGLRPEKHRVWDNETHFRQFNPGALTLPQAFRLIIGALVLFNSPGTPDFQRVSVPLVVATSLVTGGIFLVVLTFALRAQKIPSRRGPESLVGRTGKVSGRLARSGFVQVGSER